MRTRKWYWAFLVANAASGATSLLLPLYVHFLGGSARDVGAIASVASLIGVGASLLWGRLSDKTRRRRVFVLVSFAGLALVYGLFPLVRVIPQLVLVGAAASFVWMASATVSVLILMESTPEADWEREIGRLNAYSGFGWALGLALGAGWTSAIAGLVGEGWGLRSLGLVVAVLAVGAAVLAWASLPEPPVRFTKRSFRGLAVAVGNFLYERFRYGPAHLYYLLSPVQLLRFLQGHTVFGPDLVLFYYGILLVTAGFTLIFVPLPIFLRQELGWPGGAVFAAYIVHSLTSVVAYRWARQGIMRWGHRPTLGLALLARSGAFATLALVGRLLPGWMVPALFVVTGVTWAFFQLAATAIVSRLAPEGFKGQALGAYNAIAGLGNVLGAVVGGVLFDFLGFSAAFLVGASVVFLTIPLLLLEARPLKTAEG